MDPNPVEFEPIAEHLYPMYGEIFWWNFVFVEIAGVVVSTPFVLTLTEPFTFRCLFGYMLVAAILAPILFLTAFIKARKRYRKGGSIVFNGERISVHHDFEGNHCFCSENLTECRWFRGGRSWATVPWSKNFLGPWLTGPSLLIEFPARCQTEARHRTDKKGKKRIQYPPGPVIVAVGHTPEMERRWEDVLFRGGIRHDEQREAQPAPVTDEYVKIAFLTTLTVSLLIACGLAKLLYDVLLQWQIRSDITNSVWFCTVLLGAALPTFALIAFVHLRRRNQDVKMSGKMLATRWEVVAVWFWGPVLIITFGFCVESETTYLCKTIVSIVVVLILLAAAEIFRQAAGFSESYEKPTDQLLHTPKENITVDDFSKYSGHFDDSSYETKP